MPLSVVVDLFFNSQVSPFLVYLGMALIAIGFMGFCVTEFVAVRKESVMEQLFLRCEAFLTRHLADSSCRDHPS